MALNEFGLGVTFSADDKLSGPLKGVQSQFNQTQKKVNSSVSSIAGGLGKMALGFVGAGAALNIIKGAGQFQFEMAAVKNITQATASEMDSLAKAAKRAGIETQFSPQEAAQGLGVLGSQGFNAAESIANLNPVLNLAAASMGQLGVAQAAQIGSAAVNGFGVNINDLSKTMDQMLRSTQLTALQAGDLQLALAQTAKGASTFSQSLPTTIALMGALRKTGLDTSSATTAVNNAFLKLSTDKRSQKTLSDLGISVNDAEGNFREFAEIMIDVEKATNTMTESQQAQFAETVFGQRGISALNAIQKSQTKTMIDGKLVTLQGALAFKELGKRIEAADGTAKEFTDNMNKTLPGAFTLLQGTISSLALEIGEPLAAALAPAITMFTDGLNVVLKLLSNMPNSVKFLIGFITVLGLSFLAIAPFVNIAFLPFMVIGLKVAAAVGLIVLAVKAFQAILNSTNPRLKKFQDFFQKISLFARGLFSILSGEAAEGDLLKSLSAKENKGVVDFLLSIKNVFSFIGDVATAAADAFSGEFANGMKLVGNEFGVLFDEVSALFSEIGGAIGEVLEQFGFVSGPSGAGMFLTIVKAIAKGVAALIVTGLRIVIFVVRQIVAHWQRMIGAVKMVGRFVGFLIDVGRAAFRAYVDAFTAIKAGITEIITATAEWFMSFGLVRSLVESIKPVIIEIANLIKSAIDGLIGGIIKGFDLIKKGASAIGIDFDTPAPVPEGGNISLSNEQSKVLSAKKDELMMEVDAQRAIGKTDVDLNPLIRQIRSINSALENGGVSQQAQQQQIHQQPLQPEMASPNMSQPMLDNSSAAAKDRYENLLSRRQELNGALSRPKSNDHQKEENAQMLARLKSIDDSLAKGSVIKVGQETLGRVNRGASSRDSALVSAGGMQ